MKPPERHEPSPAFSWRDRLGLCAAALAALVVQLDWLAVNLALPRISAEFSQSTTNLQWVISSFMLAFGGLLPIAGRLTDAYGRRRMTIYGTLTFMVSSGICAVAPDLLWLIIGRVLQGVGGAFVAPGSVAMISGVFEGRRKNVAIGFVMGASGAGAAFGPFVGGILAEFNWRYVFCVNLPVCALAIPLIHWCVRPSRDPVAAAQRPPLVSAAAVVLGFVGVTLAIDRGPTWGWTSAATLLVAGTGFLLLIVFVLKETKGSSPLHDHAFYRDPDIQLLTATGALSVVGYSILCTFSAIYLEVDQGLSPLAAGCLFLAISFPDALFSYAAGKVAASTYTYVYLCAAMAITALGILLVTWAETLGLYVVAFIICGLGIGLTYGLTNLMTQHRVASEKAGAAISLGLAAKMLASAIAIALAATSLEALNRGVSGAATNTGALETILRAAGLLIGLGSLLLVPRAATSLRSPRNP
ncbi:MFS transporter [Streptomyces sp. NPDC051776]|uniref:MFS transporter n=1 Tax=Streptomyces sp. NPDC051776 TaxID=3155414 RepID=UPI0034288148